MLKLVVNNDAIIHKTNVMTCRNTCELFDEITESCSIKKNVDVDSIFETSRCGHYLPKDVINTYKRNKLSSRFSLIQEDEDSIIDDDVLFHELLGKNIKNDFFYPNKPDYPANREDAYWHVSPCGTYGCWIINKSKKKFSVLSQSGEVEMGWNKKVYKSTIPLHDHQSSLSLASRMTWVVDEEGFGQYALLVNGTISSLSSPRPNNWKRTY